MDQSLLIPQSFMEINELIELLKKKDEAYKKFLESSKEYNFIKREIKDIFLSIPEDSRDFFMKKDGRNYHMCCNYSDVSITKENDGTYRVTCTDCFRGEYTYYTRESIPEEELFEFLTNNEEWVKKEKELYILREEEEKRKIEEKERAEYERLKVKFEHNKK